MAGSSAAGSASRSSRSRRRSPRASACPGPAARAGFAQGDVILSVNGRDIERMRDLPLIVAEMPVGQPAEVTVWRRGQRVTLRPVIGLMPEDRQTAELSPPAAAPQSAQRADIAAGLRLA